MMKLGERNTKNDFTAKNPIQKNQNQNQNQNQNPQKSLKIYSQQNDNNLFRKVVK